MRMYETKYFDSHDAHNAKEEGEGDKEKDNARGRLWERQNKSKNAVKGIQERKND